jgi:hypothetical protein
LLERKDPDAAPPPRQSKEFVAVSLIKALASTVLALDGRLD